jgi:hypothetical protein
MKLSCLPRFGRVSRIRRFVGWVSRASRLHAADLYGVTHHGAGHSRDCVWGPRAEQSVILFRRGEACLALLPHPVLWIEGDACVAPTEKFCVIPGL